MLDGATARVTLPGESSEKSRAPGMGGMEYGVVEGCFCMSGYTFSSPLQGDF